MDSYFLFHLQQLDDDDGGVDVYLRDGIDVTCASVVLMVHHLMYDGRSVIAVVGGDIAAFVVAAGSIADTWAWGVLRYHHLS